MRDDIVPEDCRVVVADLDVSLINPLCQCQSMYLRCCTGLPASLLRLPSTNRELPFKCTRVHHGVRTESFLLRRMKAGPGVKAASATGSTAMAVHIAIWESFMMNWSFGLLQSSLWIEWAVFDIALMGTEPAFHDANVPYIYSVQASGLACLCTLCSTVSHSLEALQLPVDYANLTDE